MDEQGTETIADIDSQIAEIRSTPGYLGEEFRHNTIEQKATDAKMKKLYARKRELTGESGQGETPEPGNERFVESESIDGNGDLSEQAQVELYKLEALGVDVSDESVEDMTPEYLSCIKQERMITEGDFNGVASSLSKAANRAGLPKEDVTMIRTLAHKIKDDDAKDILRAVARYIYLKRTKE